MKSVFVRLLPPRADFVQTLTPDEATLMERHATYWRQLHETGQVSAYGLGLVADPQGFYGVGIIQLPDDANLDALLDGDPTIIAAQGFRFEVFAMPRALVRT
jgi:hypothetical protein